MKQVSAFQYLAQYTYINLYMDISCYNCKNPELYSKGLKALENLINTLHKKPLPAVKIYKMLKELNTKMESYL